MITIKPPARTIRFAFASTLALSLLLLQSTSVFAHHSAALFYSMGSTLHLHGKVISFKFSNPHAILILEVTDDKGDTVQWTCETSAPSALRRNGWSQQSIAAGEVVTIDGIPARDGTHLMRITGVTKADGTKVGVSSRRDD